MAFFTLGIKDFATLEMFLTLGDYGMDSLMAIEFGKILERDFELFLTLQEIRSLNVRDICLMAGVSNAVDAAKLFQSQSFVAPTFLESAKKHYNLTELVPKNAIVLLRQVRERKEIMFLVHPMEGSVVPIMESLANHMQVTTYGINCTADADLSSVETLAASYIKVKAITKCAVSRIGCQIFRFLFYGTALHQNCICMRVSSGAKGGFSKTTCREIL